MAAFQGVPRVGPIVFLKLFLREHASRPLLWGNAFELNYLLTVQYLMKTRNTTGVTT